MNERKCIQMHVWFNEGYRIMSKNKKRYLITGISGFIGSTIAKKLLESSATAELEIYGIVRDKEKCKEIFEGYECSNITLIEMDICDTEKIRQLCGKIDYIIHCASVTKSKEMMSNPVEVADGIVLGTRNILELAKLCEVKSMVYLSSMEAYGVVQDTGKRRTEEELGSIDLTAPRSCYPMGKRMAEHYCHIYHIEYGIPVKIARLSQVFGKGVPANDSRVFMQFANAVRTGKDIVLRTKGESLGNYCSTEDAIEGIFTILENGENGEIYNIVNEENTMRIIDMAHLVASQVAKDKIKVHVDLEPASKTGYAPDTKLRMSAEKLRAIGWLPKKSMVDMYNDILEELHQ